MGEGVELPVPTGVPVIVGDTECDRVVDPVSDALGDAVPVGVCESDPVGALVVDGVSAGETDGVADGVDEGEAVADDVATGVPDKETVDVGVAEGVVLDVADRETVVLGVPDSDCVVLGVPDPDCVVLGVLDADSVVLGVPDADSVVLGVPDADSVVLGVVGAVIVRLAVPDTVGDREAVPDTDGVRVRERVGELVRERELVGVPVPVDRGVPIAVGVSFGDREIDGVIDGVADGVFDSEGGSAATSVTSDAAGTLIDTKTAFGGAVKRAPLHSPVRTSKPSTARGAATYRRAPSGDTATSAYKLVAVSVSPPTDDAHMSAGAAVGKNSPTAALHDSDKTTPPEKARKRLPPSGETAKPRAPSCGALATIDHAGGDAPPAAAAADASARFTLATPLCANPGTSNDTKTRCPTSAHLRATAPATGSGLSCISIRDMPSMRDGGEPAAAGSNHRDPPLSTHALEAPPTPGGEPAARTPPSASDQPEEMSA